MNNSEENFSIKEYKPKTNFLKKYWRILTGLFLGAIGGYLYYYFIGCASGACPMTSNPYSSVIFGAAFGYFLLNSPCSQNKC